MANALHPALIIGLGGSGIEIVRRFRRRLQKDYPDTPHVRFLGIDTDPQSPERPDAPRLPDEFFYHAGNFNMAQYVSAQNIQHFREIRAWWQGYQSLPYAFVATGAGQRRPIGRLALFVHFDNIKAYIERELRAIYSTNSFAELDPVYRRSITVYIVASTCGGTGTGMFLDVAYVARQLVPEIVNRATPTVRGVLLMPSVFTATGQVPRAGVDALHANAFGALTELDYCMNTMTRREPIKFPTRTGEWPVSRDDKPFDSCFLLGNQDAQGAVYNSWSDLVERAAAHLHIDLASSLGNRGQSILTNVESWMWAQPQVNGLQRVYSSLNADTIELPSARIRARWTKRFSALLVDRLEAPTGATARNGATMAGLEHAAGFGWLRRVVDGDGYREFLPKVDQYRNALLSINPENPVASELVGAATNLEMQAKRQLDKAPIAGAVGEAMEQVPDEVDAALREVLGTGSLADGLKLLADVRRVLDELAEKAQARRRHSAGDWLRSLGAAAGKQKGVFERKEAYVRRLQDAAARAIGEAELAWEQVLWSKISEGLNALTALPRARAHLDRRQNQLERTAALLDSVRPLLARVPEPIVSPGMQAAISDAEIDQAFEAPDRQARLQVFVREHLGQLLTHEAPTMESLFERLLLAAAHAVSTIAADFVAGSEIGADRIAERLSRLQPLAVFSQQWGALTLGGGVPESQQISLVGVPLHMDARRSEIRAELPVEYRDTQIETIGDTDQVLMFTQHHGYPLFAMAEMAACKRAFEADQSGKALRFTLPEPEVRRWDIEPVSANASNLWFAMALALGYVERVGTDYIYRPPTHGHARGEQDLVRGEFDKASARQKARDAFLKGGFASAFEATWNEEIRRLGGNETVHRKLSGWIERESERATHPEYTSEFRDDLELVKQYAAQLT